MINLCRCFLLAQFDQWKFGYKFLAFLVHFFSGGIQMDLIYSSQKASAPADFDFTELQY